MLGGAIFIISEPNKYLVCSLIYRLHDPDLLVLLFVVVLIDAKSIGPDQSGSARVPNSMDSILEVGCNADLV